MQVQDGHTECAHAESETTLLVKGRLKHPNVDLLLTQRPVGAPWIAICLVLTTVRGKRHVVTPCKAVKVNRPGPTCPANALRHIRQEGHKA